MGAITYSIKQMGRGFKLSDHFTLGEMASKDGADIVKVNPDLIDFLEYLRNYFGATISITSGYRTAAHNEKVGGAAYSQHIYGNAADVIVKKNGSVVPAKIVCCAAQTMGFKGIGYISSTSTHLDMRPSGSYRGDERKGYSNNVGGDFYKFFGIKGSDVMEYRAEPPKGETKKEDDEMTQDQFDKFMDNWLAARAKKKPGNWSAESRQWAEQRGLITGTSNGKEYQSFCTREQLVEILNRFRKLL